MPLADIVTCESQLHDGGPAQRGARLTMRAWCRFPVAPLPSVRLNAVWSISATLW